MPTLTRDGGFLLVANSSSDGTISFVVPAGGIPAGKLVVLGVTNADADLDVTSVVDSRSNSWSFDTRQVQAAQNSNTFAAAWCILTTALQAADTITITWNSTGFNEFTGICEWFGSDTGWAGKTGTTIYAQDIGFPQSQPNIGTFNADQPDELDVCVYSLCLASLTVTPTSGWTSTLGKDEDTSSPQTTFNQHRISHSETGLATGITTSTDVYWGGLLLRFAPVTASNQHLAPSADSVDGTWTDQAAGTALAAAIDESSASDTDYIQSVDSPSAAGCRVKLASGSDPSLSTGHVIHWRVAKNNTGQTVDVTVKLYQGGGNSIGAGTLIATRTRTNVGTTFTTYDETLTGTEADAITNYTDLYLEFYATAS